MHSDLPGPVYTCCYNMSGLIQLLEGSAEYKRKQLPGCIMLWSLKPGLTWEPGDNSLTVLWTQMSPDVSLTKTIGTYNTYNIQHLIMQDMVVVSVIVHQQCKISRAEDLHNVPGIHNMHCF